MKRLLLITALSSAVTLAAAPTLAQDATAPAVKSAPAQKAQREGARLPSERVEARITQLKTTLKITEAQEAPWNAFADTLRKQARSAGEGMKSRRAQSAQGAKPAALSAIERLEQRKAFLAAASSRTDELLATAKPLYAALSPEQQKIADDLIAKRDERGSRRHGGPRSRS